MAPKRRPTVQQALATHEHHDNVTEVQQFDNEPPELPALRLFKVTVQRTNHDGTLREDIHMIQAHSYGTKRDLATFSVMQTVRCANPECDEWHVVTTSPRAIRPVLDVEEVFEKTSEVM